jgi:hypothetical protein
MSYCNECENHDACDTGCIKGAALRGEKLQRPQYWCNVDADVRLIEAALDAYLAEKPREGATPRTDAMVSAWGTLATLMRDNPSWNSGVLAEKLAERCDEAADLARQLEWELAHTSAELAGLKRTFWLQTLPSATPAMEKLLRDLLDRAYKMMEMAGYKVVEQNPDHNNPIISWMADARTMLYGSGHKPDMARDLRTKT